MIYEKIISAIKMFESGDVNEVTIDVDDVIINITRKGFTSQSKKYNSEWIIHSPFVGVVHLNNTDEVPYVEQNQMINKNDSICIIESLKIQHDILSEYTGYIEEIYVKDKDFVEYNQPMFKIKQL